MGIITNKKGFTLVEVIVVALLLLVLTGAGFGFFFAFVREKEGAAKNMILQARAEALIDDIGKNARTADFIDTAFGPPTKRATGTAAVTRNTVYFCRMPTGEEAFTNPFAGYRVNGAVLQECTKNSSNLCSGSNNWTNMPAIFNKIILDGGYIAAGTSSTPTAPFVVSADRGSLEIGFILRDTTKSVRGGDTARVKIPRIVFKVRGGQTGID